jgi:NAD(P)-dependent dehydrogenase (short-subunit alcohol dehydrogenase family)
MQEVYMRLLEDKIAVVTGSSRGFGLAIAEAFADHGAAVVLASRSEEAIGKAIESIRATGARASGLVCDTTDLKQVEALAEHAVKTFGGLHVWVNNAGMSPTYGPTAHIQPDEFVRTIQTNILGTYYGSIVALRRFLPQKSGKLINILGAGARGPVPMQNAYASSKSWIRTFTLALAQEYKDSGVGVYALGPGMMLTEMLTRVRVVAGYEERLRVYPTVIRVLARPPEAAAHKVVWLASAATDGRTGSEVYLFNPVTTLLGFLRERIGRLMGQPDMSPHLDIASVPPAI